MITNNNSVITKDNRVKEKYNKQITNDNVQRQVQIQWIKTITILQIQ